MPDAVTVPEFLQETWEDFNSPTTSTFVQKMGLCRNAVSQLEETLDFDRSGLTKMKKSIKAIYNSGNMHVANEVYMAENLEKLGSNALTKEQEPDIGAAFLKFAVVTKELSALMKNLMQNLNNIVMFPLDSFVKSELKGGKGELKKPFDKAWKDYDAKFTKIEQERKKIAKEAGLHRTEVSGPEIAEEMEKERRMFQLQMVEYLVKVNEIKTKKGVDLLQHLVEYYHAQTNFYQDGMKTIEHFNSYIDDLVSQLGKIKQRQDQERRQLIELRDALKGSMNNLYKEPQPNAVSSASYSLHQLQGNKEYGSQKNGYLLKKSEGKMRKVWQRRRCSIIHGIMSISHSDETKEPVRLNLLTCQAKLVPEDPGKKCFDLVSSSKNRTYHFQAEDTKDMEAWISVLNNAKEDILMKAFGDTTESSHLRELTRGIIQEIRKLPGNACCCDCGASNPEWLSTNLGILICLECCGIHRELGVHISRTQSLVIDEIGTSQLLLAHVVSNRSFNDIMEATLDLSIKPTPNSSMEERKDFIRAKYERHRYAIVTCLNAEDLKLDLKQAVENRDIYALLQVYAEGLDLVSVLPEMESDETALHIAVEQEDGTSLHIVDFIIQNTNNRNLDKQTKDGSTALHVCSEYNQTEAMKLLLRANPNLAKIENSKGQTALDIAKQKGHQLCVELIEHSMQGKTELLENVNIDWDLMMDDHIFDAVDYSDDELDEKTSPGKPRSRPPSLVMTKDSIIPIPARHRTASASDELKPNCLPPPPPPAQNKPKGLVPQSSNSLKRKPPAPLPPAGFGHSRNPSDPSSINTHRRIPSDSGPPPPLPAKKGEKGIPAGGKFVLPPPPEFRNSAAQRDSGDKGSGDSKPRPAPRRSALPGEIRSGAGEGKVHSVDTQLKEKQTKDKQTIEKQTTDKQTIEKQTIEKQTTGKLTTDKYSNGNKSSDSLDSVDSGGKETQPVPTPRMRKKVYKKKRCQALYDCEADNEDELSFKEGEIILLVKTEDEDWWEGEIEGQPERKGLFPASFVKIVNEASKNAT